jgi:hypothetical protein
LLLAAKTVFPISSGIPALEFFLIGIFSSAFFSRNLFESPRNRFIMSKIYAKLDRGDLGSLGVYGEKNKNSLLTFLLVQQINFH